MGILGVNPLVENFLNLLGFFGTKYIDNPLPPKAVTSSKYDDTLPNFPKDS